MTKRLTMALLLTAALLCSQALAGPPVAGEVLPPLTIAPLAVEGDSAILGLKDNCVFTLADIKTEYVLIEILGVYCPVCREMSSSLTRLYKRIRKARLDDRITMLGIAAGATPMEVRYVRPKDYVFPVAHDTEFEIHKALAEPKTPYTMIVDREGKVYYAHLGIIPDFNAFFQEIQNLVK
ncbi:MAG: TlpA disulfide reductase family protein [Pseudodesulfovibrio sp.]|uniref:TlpA disulfide reductase family protein n=1 Tax=Pseudodesulfovibrio sp. TaxID=2035812 RepID=UPI003D0F7650